MLTSLLLHLPNVPLATATIGFSVQLAAREAARIRALSLLDTRRLTTLVDTRESAIFCTGEMERLTQVDIDQESACAYLQRACAAADVTCEVCPLRGDPLALLPSEAQFHDLVITAIPDPCSEIPADHGLSAADVLPLLDSGVHPLLILRPQRVVQRVLLVSDDSPSSATAIRLFLSQRLFPEAELRLVAIGNDAAVCRERLRLLTEYAHQRLQSVESGFLRGTVRRVLLPYARKWEADLVVLGSPRRSPFWGPLFRQPVEQILRETELAVFVTS